MGNYVDSTDVLKLLLDLNLGLSRLTTADIEQSVGELEALVDGVLVAQGYTPVPVVAASAIRVIAGPLRKKAAVDVYYTLYQTDRSPEWSKTWDMDWEEFLTALRKGQIRLPDADPTVAQDQEAVLCSLRIMPALPEDD